MPLDLGVPTTMGVPVNADAGTVPEIVSGAVNLVVTETQLFPFQYSMTLALVKIEFDMLIVTETSDPKAPLVEATLTS